MAYKVSVDKKTCIGCSACEVICPSSFKMKKGKAVATKKIIEEIRCETEAKEACPVNAIKIEKFSPHSSPE